MTPPPITLGTDPDGAGRPGSRRRRVAATASVCAVLGLGLASVVPWLPAPAAGATVTSTTATTKAPSGSTTSTTESPQDQIAGTESQVAALEQQIAQEQDTLDRADEQYDQAQVRLSTTQASLAAATAQLQQDQARVARDRATLRSAAVASYVGDSSSLVVAQLFTTPSASGQAQQVYESIGSASIVAEVAHLRSGQRALARTRASLLQERRAEQAQLATVQQTRQAAQATANQSEATLAQVKGALGAEVAKQAAAQAVQAAATARVATTAAAQRSAAAQANQAAQVASTVANGSSAASAATTAANQAAATAGSSAPVAPSGGSDAAGIAAVQAAVGYLGVPYVWGGASRAGVDCSGLVMLAWAQAGVTMDHSAADQYATFPHVSLSALEPGDLLFYDLDGSGIDHVVMYVGPTLSGSSTAYGSSTIIQAAHTGTVVSFDPLWTDGLVGAARP